MSVFIDDGSDRPDASLVLDGESHEPIDGVVPAAGQVAVAFQFPAPGVEATSGRLEWCGRSRSLSDETLDRLAAPPLFDVRKFSVPAEATAEDIGDAEVTATIVVENTGGADGRFVAELGTTALSDQGAIAVRVPAGERVTATRSVRLVQPKGEEPVVLKTTYEMFKRTVLIREN